MDVDEVLYFLGSFEALAPAEAFAFDEPDGCGAVAAADDELRMLKFWSHVSDVRLSSSMEPVIMVILFVDDSVGSDLQAYDALTSSAAVFALFCWSIDELSTVF